MSDTPPIALAALEPHAGKTGRRRDQLEEQVALLMRCTAALNREVGELRCALGQHAPMLARLAAEEAARDETGGDREA